MSRRKAFVRHAADRVPSEICSPTELSRLRTAALAGMRSAEWGSEVGRLHLSGRLTTAELSIAKRWFALVSAYSTALRSPKAPTTVQLDAIGSQPSDPDSDVGAREARRDRQAVTAWIEGRDALRKAGRDVESIIDDVVVRDLARTSFDEIAALKAGLAALSSQWAARRKAAR